MKKFFFILFICSLFLSTNVFAREVTINLSTGSGYLGSIDDSAYNIRNLPDFIFNFDIAVQGTRRLYPMIEAEYAHNTRKGSFFSSGLDMIGFGAGIKAVVKPRDYSPETTMALDRSRYWFSATIGPYITRVSSGTGGIADGTSRVDIGVNFGAGIEYYFSPYVGAGGQIKMAYVTYDDSYFLLNIGPSLCLRF